MAVCRGGAARAAIAAVIVAAGACGRTHDQDSTPGGGASDAGVRIDAGPRGGGPGGGGPGGSGSGLDGGREQPRPTEPGPTQPTQPPPPTTIGDATPLGEALSFAFIAGYHDQEQIWLRGAEGGLVRITSWTTDPPYTESCGAGWSTGGYIGGRFSRLQLDATGEYLLFTENVRCNDGRQEYTTRVLAHELASGTTVVLAETSVRPSIATTEQAAVVVVRYAPAMFPAKPLAPDDIELFEFEDGALAPIEVPQGDAWLDTQDDGGAQLVAWNDRSLLLVEGLPALEKVDGVWRASSAMDALAKLEIGAVASSPSQSRLCVTTSTITPEGRQDAIGWVLGPTGDWLRTTLTGSRWTPDCTWSPDEATVAFEAYFYEVLASGLTARTSLLADVIITGAWRGALYGIDGGRAIVRVDWSALEAQTVLDPIDALPALCAANPFGAAPGLILPPDDRALAIVKMSCGCIDCDISGSVAWHAETSEVETIEEVWGEHQVYGVAWLPGGGAAVLSTQLGRSASEQESESRPAPGSFFLVSADGKVETVPLPGVEGVMHSPLAARAN